MQTFTINFNVPESWYELSDKQLRYVYQLIADRNSAAELKVLCLLKWGGAKVLGRQANSSYHMSKGNFVFEISPLTLAELSQHLDWVEQVPTSPVRLSRINRRNAINADFQGVPFESYIICDNLYQGYLQTQDDTLLNQLAAVLYPDNDKPITLKPCELISVFYWMASLKDYFSRRFPHFLKPCKTQNANLLGSSANYGALLQASMDAQIRALTKGDITKEAEILEMNTWRALAELDAQAQEYEELEAATQP